MRVWNRNASDWLGSTVTSARGVRLSLSRLPSISNNVTVVSDLPKRVCMMCVWECTLCGDRKCARNIYSLAGLGGSGEARNRAVWLAAGHEGVVRGMPTATTPAVSRH
jgi:hypothetical protein